MRPPIRVAQVIDDLSFGGAERIVQRLALGLAERGHAAHIICLKAARADVSALRSAGVHVHALHARPRDPAVFWRLAALLRTRRIALVHAHSSAALVTALPVCKLLGRLILFTRHGALLGPPSVYRRLADRVNPFVDGTILVAESLRGAIPAHAARVAARFIPNGIDVVPVARAEARAALEHRCRRPFSGPVVLSVGTISPEKDTLAALAAFATVARAHSNATLVLVGGTRDADYARAVDRRIAELRLAPHVLRLGPVDEAWRLMAGADVFLSSSRTEAMPLAIIEAMSQRVPIVATAVGDVGVLPPRETPARPTLLSDHVTALLAPPGDADRLAAAMLECLHDRPAAAARAAEAQRHFQQKYTAAQMLDEHEKLYESLLATRRRRSPHTLPRARRVLMIGPAPAEIGGINSVIESLSAALARRGFDVRRFGWPSADAAGSSGRRTLPGRVTRQLRSLLGLAWSVWHTKPDVVHLHTCSGVSFVRSALDQAVCRLLGRRTILHIHSGRFDAFCRGAGRFLRRLIRHTCETAARVIVLSDAAAGALRHAAGAAVVEVIPNGVAFGAASPGPRGERPCRFVFLGELRRAKGLFELLDAARALVERGFAFCLTLVGPAAQCESVDWAAEIARRGLNAHVNWVGPLRGRAKEQVLEAADCLVLPSHVEAMPMVVLEAAAAGLAVVATEVGGIPALVGPDLSRDVLVPPGDIERLADVLGRMAAQPRFRARVASALRDRVRAAFDIDAIATRVAALYERIGNEPRGARIDELFARGVAYPLHEAIRGRATLKTLATLGTLAQLAPEALACETRRRLAALLEFAGSALPFHRRRLGLLPRSSDPHERLSRLPVLDKRDIRAAGDALVWRGVPGGLRPMTSGGTTGDTLHFHVDRARIAEDHAARLFMQRLFGVRPGDRRAYLWGSPIEGRSSRARRVRDRVIGELLLDAFDLSTATLDRRLREIRRFQPRVLYGYPSALARLARRALEHCRPTDFASLRVVVLTGEEITAEQRAIIARAFGAPVASEYGNREVGLIAHECPAGALHVIAPHILVEIVTRDGVAPPGAVGSIVCTTLNLRGQPFIRYRVGDAGQLEPGACACGLPFPVMRLEGGKITGLMALPGGRFCHGAVSSYALRGIAGIVAFRTHQRQIDHIEVLLEVDAAYQPASAQLIRQRYRRLFGSAVRVDCRVVDRIPPDPSGKRRHFISDVAEGHELAGTIENVESVLVD